MSFRMPLGLKVLGPLREDAMEIIAVFNKTAASG